MPIGDYLTPGMNREKLRSVTVSYKRVDIPLVTSRVGYGKTYKEALADADNQLSGGTWERLVISDPSSIKRNLIGTREARLSRRTLRQGEGEFITVERSATVTVVNISDGR